MDPNTPMVIAGAKYATRNDAVEAYKVVWGARHQGEFDHMDVAVLTKVDLPQARRLVPRRSA